MSFDIFSYAYGGFDQLLNDHVLATSAKVAEVIGPVAWTLMGIYIVFWGFCHIRGLIDEPVTDGAFRMIKLTVILGMALNTALYGEHVIQFAMKAPEALASAIALNGSTVSEAGIATTGDAIVSSVIETASEIWSEAGVMNGNFGHYLIAIFFIVGGTVIAAIGFLLYLSAKVGLVFSLSIGPIFILMAMFDSTRPYFNSWVNVVVGFMVSILFVLFGIGFGFAFFEDVAIGAAELALGKQVLMGITQLSAASTIGIACILVAKGMATSIISGFNLSIRDAMHQAGAAKRAAGGAIGMPGKAARGALNAARLGKAAAAVATGGKAAIVSGAAAGVGAMFRASNSIRRG